MLLLWYILKQLQLSICPTIPPYIFKTKCKFLTTKDIVTLVHILKHMQVFFLEGERFQSWLHINQSISIHWYCRSKDTLWKYQPLLLQNKFSQFAETFRLTLASLWTSSLAIEILCRVNQQMEHPFVYTDYLSAFQVNK